MPVGMAEGGPKCIVRRIGDYRAGCLACSIIATTVVRQEALEVVWPLKRRQISLDSITGVRIVNSRDLKPQVSWGIRVGAGGLWGGFGWLLTQRRGIVQMYISRINDLVWIDRKAGRPWLVSPERPQEFVHALSDQNPELPDHR
ncbi:MAG TPA: PH domain-containing protein [Nitrospiraceae bacterium]|nr:PH domain-containing protein [Nitrospiraceae bacterium]